MNTNFFPALCHTPMIGVDVTVFVVATHGVVVEVSTSPLSTGWTVVAGALQPAANIAWPAASQFCEYVWPFQTNAGTMSRASWWPRWPWKTPDADGEMTTKGCEAEPVAWQIVTCRCADAETPFVWDFSVSTVTCSAAFSCDFDSCDLETCTFDSCETCTFD